MLDIIHTALSLVWLFCFIYVVVKMFQNGQTVLGIVTLVLACCAGLGTIIAFAFGWIRSSQWNIKGLMLIWTVAIIGWLILSGFHTPDWINATYQKAQQQVK